MVDWLGLFGHFSMIQVTFLAMVWLVSPQLSMPIGIISKRLQTIALQTKVQKMVQIQIGFLTMEVLEGMMVSYILRQIQFPLLK